MMPGFPIVKAVPGVGVIVKELAPGLKVSLPICVSAEVETAVALEKPKTALSPGPLGNHFGVQSRAEFQLPLGPGALHWAVPALAIKP